MWMSASPKVRGGQDGLPAEQCEPDEDGESAEAAQQHERAPRNDGNGDLSDDGE